MTIRSSVFLAAILVLGLALAAVFYANQPPAPVRVDAPADYFSAERAYVILQRLLVEGVPHPVGSRANAKVRERIVEFLRNVGYEVRVQESLLFAQRRGPIYNITAQMPGLESGPAVILMAHYDSVRYGPGVADDGAGVATVLEIARMLKAHGPMPNSVIFLLTDGEEAGQIGAEAFMREHPWAKQAAVAINLESRGTSGRSLMYEISNNNAWLVDVYASSVKNPDTSSIFFEVYNRLPFNSDLRVLKKYGMAGMSFAFIESGENYHTPQDNLKNLDLGSLQHQGENALAVLRVLAEKDLGELPKGNAVYSDVLGLVVPRWPESWSLPMAVLCFVLVIACAGSLVYRSELSASSLLWAMAAWMLMVLVPMGFGMCLKWTMPDMIGFLKMWPAHMTAARWMLWMMVFFSAGMIAMIFSRSAGFWGLLLCAWIVWSILSIAAAVFMPGMCSLFLIPLIVASISLSLSCLTRWRNSPWAIETAAIVALAATAIIWLKAALLAWEMVGFRLIPLTTAPLSIIMTATAPFFVVTGRGRFPRWVVLAIAFLAWAAAFVMALRSPAG